MRGWVMTMIWPAYEGSLMISWYPLMQVLNTTSPSLAATPAPNRKPSHTAPDSSASRPATGSATGRLDQLRPRQQVRVVVGDHTVAEGEQNATAQTGAPQRRVPRQ